MQNVRLDLKWFTLHGDATKYCTGCLKKNAMKIQQAVVHHKLNYRTKELLFSFFRIYFLSRNDEKWPHTRQIKIFGRNHILPPLGIKSTLFMQS